MINFNYYFFLWVFTLICVSTSCNGKQANESQTKNTAMINNDEDAIRSIISNLEKDYQAIMGMYELDMEVFVDDRDAYVEQYQSIINDMVYMSPSFKGQLMDRLNAQEVSAETSNLRPIVDPLFKAEYVADAIRIIALDIEESKAAASMQLHDSMDKTQCCHTELFLDKINGKWMITGHDVSESVRSRIASTISAERFVGLYQLSRKDGQAYSITKRGEAFQLEFCVEECEVVGVIEEVQMLTQNEYEIIIENVSGEMVPRYIIEDMQMKVHEYNAVDDQWEDNVYLFSQGRG